MASAVENEKSYEVDERMASSSPSTTDVQRPREEMEVSDVGTGEVDAAWKFLDEHRDVDGVDQVNLKKLRMKIDWRIVPLMFGCYTMQFLDKVIYNVSNFPFPTPRCALVC